MTEQVNVFQKKVAKIAGFMYVFNILGSVLNAAFILSRFNTGENGLVAAAKIMSGQLLFRAGTVIELFMYSSVIILAMSLYLTLKPYNKSIALIGAGLRVVESSVGVLAAIMALTAAGIINNSAFQAVFGAKESQALTAIFLNARVIASDGVIFFCGLGSFIFFCLFFKSGYIPRLLGAWGLLSYLICIVFPAVKFLYPGLAGYDMIIYSPGGIFEITIGFWLLVKGIKIRIAK